MQITLQEDKFSVYFPFDELTVVNCKTQINHKLPSNDSMRLVFTIGHRALIFTIGLIYTIEQSVSNVEKTMAYY